MNRLYSVAIIGGGASGLACATKLCQCKVRGEDVLLIERNDRVAKKLLVTGNGQGNLTNTNLDKRFYHGDEGFICDFLSKTQNNEIEDFFNSLGIYLCSDENGRVYPISKQANAVVDGFRNFLTFNNVNIKTGEKVTSIKKDNYYLIKTDKGEYNAKVVVLAFGGKSGSQYGTDGTSYVLSKPFGHTISNLFPSLMQVLTERQKIKGLKGIKEVAEITLFDGDKKIISSVGDILFTDYGVSGNAVFKISSYIFNLKNPKIKLSFIPNLSKDKIEQIIKDKLALPFIDKSAVLSSLVSKMVGNAIIKNAKSFSPKDIAYSLKNFFLSIEGNTGFDCSQVTKGGVNTKDIDSNTFESKLSNNLYIVGEALNIDGDCGGYNLTFAFISGITAGKCIANKLNEKK